MIEDSQLQQLITALGEDFELTGEEIADVLWLAVQRLKYSGTVTEIPTTEPEGKPGWSKLINLITQIGNSINKKQPQAASSVQSPATAIKKEPTVPIYPETPSSVTTPTSQVLPIRVPDAPSLREPLQVAQSLRPLMRKIASGRKVILDEIATAKRIAEHKIYLPILKPETEPWLDLALVIDESQSMAIWRHTIEDLKRLVQNYGVFRDVRIWGLVTDEAGEVKLLPRIGTKGKEQRFANPRELIDPNGRRLILVVSDCVSRLWYDGAIIPPLQAWSQRQPLAILQMLPDWLWLRTGLGNGASVLLKSLAPGVANQKLEVEELLLRKDFALSEGIKIPVLTLDPDLASLWSEMVSGKSEAVTSGFVLPPQLESDEKSLPETEVAQLDAAGRITRFRQTASPIARKLAGLLAAAPVINLPVVRLIQDTLLPQSNQVHVAEVFLGGLLKPLIVIEADTNPDTVQYDFMDDGIRQIFLKDAPVSDSAAVFDAVSQYVAQKLNKSLQEFVALLKAPGEEPEKDISAFAEVAIKVLKGLGGEYARFAEENLVNTSSVPNTNTGDVNSQESIQAQLSTHTFDVATIEIEETDTHTFEFTVATLERQQSEEKQETTQWVIKRQKQQATGIIEVLEEGIELELMEIPGGSFFMGSPADELERSEDESPQHEVNVSSFFMGKYPITQAQWRVVAGWESVERKLDVNPAYFKDREDSDRRPVEQVSWYDAKEFCARLSQKTKRDYRLPTEAEWEYACRAVIREHSSAKSEQLTVEEWNEKYHQPFHFGETISTELANYDGNYTYGRGVKGKSRGETTKVEYFQFANAFGLYDMHGNVFEWCEDHSKDSSARLSSYKNIIKVRRGGSWKNQPKDCRSAYRVNLISDYRNNTLGLRVVLRVAPRTQ